MNTNREPLAATEQITDLGVAQEFPLLQQHPELSYLDSAATTHQPESVLAAQAEFTQTLYGPVHRAVYDLGAAATGAYEAARQTVARFIGAREQEVIFTKNATEALNLVAWWEQQRLTAGDEILLSVAEHHSNLLPWQRAAQERGAKLMWAEVREGRVDVDDVRQKITPRTKVVALTQLSNVLGESVPVATIVAAAHAVGAHVVIDAAQSVGRLPVNVEELGVDYLVFSGHKMYGPTGIGVLWARERLLERAEPLQLGGGMVGTVTRHGAEWLDGPARFEGGTPPVTQAIGLAAAVSFIEKVGVSKIWQHEQALAHAFNAGLSALPYVTIFGPPLTGSRAAIFSWQVLLGEQVVHSHDVATILNERGVAIRAGHHCAQVLLSALGVQELCRASVGVYTTQKDVDALISALEAVYAVFGQAIKKRATVPSF